MTSDANRGEKAAMTEEGEKLQVLLFRLDQEIYAIEISCIHEVLEYSKVTKVTVVRIKARCKASCSGVAVVEKLGWVNDWRRRVA